MVKKKIVYGICCGIGLVLVMTIGLRKETAIYTQANEYPKPIAITFDDGPNAVYTSWLLDELQKRNVKASFFVIGEKANENQDLIRRISEEGHLLGNHTYSHMLLEKSNRQVFLEELIKTNEILEGITEKEVTFVRPPFGRWEKELEAKTNLFPVLWTIDPVDWCCQDTAKIVNNVVKNAKENDIILLHDNYKTSVEAAIEIIDILSKNNFYFVTVDEILLD